MFRLITWPLRLLLSGQGDDKKKANKAWAAQLLIPLALLAALAAIPINLWGIAAWRQPDVWFLTWLPGLLAWVLSFKWWLQARECLRKKPEPKWAPWLLVTGWTVGVSSIPFIIRLLMTWRN